MPIDVNQAQIDLKDFRILIVEDFHFISEVLSLSLKEIGVGHVFTAENGTIAQNKVQIYNCVEGDKNIDVIVLDWLMPEMDGREFIKWLRAEANDAIRFIPVIVCSAYTSKTLVNETRDLGVNEVVVKPVSASEIARRIQYVINHPRAFVKSKTFFGPDRRRRKSPFDGEEKRKARPQDIKKNHG